MKRQTKDQRFIEDMTRCRGMDWVRLGMMIEVDGHLGTIKGMNSSANLDVEFTNQLKWGKGTHNCHPTWETRYFDAEGNVIKDYRRQAEASKSQASNQKGEADKRTSSEEGAAA